MPDHKPYREERAILKLCDTGPPVVIGRVGEQVGLAPGDAVIRGSYVFDPAAPG